MLARPLLWLIENGSFIAAGIALVMALRALLTGTVRVNTRNLPARTLSERSNPVQFWLELALYAVVIPFLILMGLFMHGVAPHWFADLVRRR